MDIVAFNILQHHRLALYLWQGIHGLLNGFVQVESLVGFCHLVTFQHIGAFAIYRLVAEMTHHMVVNHRKEESLSLLGRNGFALFPERGESLLHEVLRLLPVAAAVHRVAVHIVGPKAHSIVVFVPSHFAIIIAREAKILQLT